MSIIGITGKAGAGKDTVADYLVHNYGYKKISFAHTLKNMLKVAGLGEPENREDKEKNFEGFNFSFREAAQRLGCEFGRSLDEDLWVKLTMMQVDPTLSYVISDVRFNNEAEAVRSNGQIWHTLGRSVDMGALSNHASEKGVDARFCDVWLDNSGSLKALYEAVDYRMAWVD